MKKKLITLGLGLAIVATSIGAVSAAQEEVVPKSNIESATSGGFYGGMDQQEMLERRAEATGLSVAELQEQFQGMGQGPRGDMKGTPNECDTGIVEERAAAAGLTVDEFKAQQEIDRETFKADRRQQMAEMKGLSVDELGEGSQGQRGGNSNRY